MRAVGFALALFVLAVSGPSAAKAWGVEGHQIIADIAEKHLTPRAAARVAEILGGARMRDVANYADEIRPLRRDTSRWHFVNIEPGASDYVAERDCKQIEGQGDCIIAAIDRAIADLKADGDRQREGLKLLIHFIGDLHQPFHAVSEARGGNEIKATFFGKPTNLHAVWDGDLVRFAKRAPADYAAFLDRTQLAGANFDVLTAGTTIEWALESRDIGLKALVPPGTALADPYVVANLPIAEQQLALAAIRLSAIFNAAFK